jgi:NhaP-type Na+/H+ or K+/H+ antiporter
MRNTYVRNEIIVIAVLIIGWYVRLTLIIRFAFAAAITATHATTAAAAAPGQQTRDDHQRLKRA